jgi:hypothetical protein
MQTQLLAMLILASWAQQRGDGDPPPEPHGTTIVIGVSVLNGRVRQVHRVNVIIPAPDDEEEGDERPMHAVGRIDLEKAIVERASFDRWLFDDESEVQRQDRLKIVLDAKIALMASTHELSAAQRAKLQLAGRGDIKRLFDEIAERRREFETVRKNYRAGVAALRRLAPLRQACVDGPFGDGSLLTKTLQKIDEDKNAERHVDTHRHSN